jgi:hypothetical protein
LLGPLVFDAVERVLGGEPVPKWTRVEDQVFDQARATEVIDQRQY